MPTVIILDTSLSMLAPGVVLSGGDQQKQAESLLTVAKQSLSLLFSAILEQSKTEFISLVTFSDKAEIVVPFTRSVADLNSALQTRVEAQSRSCLASALALANSHCLATWGQNTFCHIVVVTDGDCMECFDYELKHTLNLASFALPTAFPSLLHLVLFSQRTATKCDFFAKLCKANIQQNNQISSDLVVASRETIEETTHWVFPVSQTVVQAVFRMIADKFYAPFIATLRCGHLRSRVQLHPAPVSSYRQIKDFEIIDRKLSTDIAIMGFIRPADLGHAAVIFRHLVLAIPETSTASPEGKHRTPGPERMPSFCALLHSSLKADELVAICRVGSDWHGMLSVLPESNKRSNLVLNYFEPGADAIPWLGNLNNLRIRPLDGSIEPKGVFPLPQAKDKAASYFTSPQQPNLAQPCWIQPIGLQTDVQKLLRYARKLPDKQVQYYQELNRLCSYAVAIGFTELLEKTLVGLLEKELSNAQANDATIKHLQHTIRFITSKNLPYGECIQPAV